VKAGTELCARSIKPFEGSRWRLRRMRADGYGNSIFSPIRKLLVLSYLTAPTQQTRACPLSWFCFSPWDRSAAPTVSGMHHETRPAEVPRASSTAVDGHSWPPLVSNLPKCVRSLADGAKANLP